MLSSGIGLYRSGCEGMNRTIDYIYIYITRNVFTVLVVSVVVLVGRRDFPAKPRSDPKPAA